MDRKDFSAMIDRISKSSKETHEYYIKICGLKFKCHPQVFSPKYHHTTELIVKNFPYIREEKLLEMGCGVMALGIYAAKNFSCEVTGADINPAAVMVANQNIDEHRINNYANAVESDLFSAFSTDEKFDTIMWDFPFVLPPSDYEVNSLHQKAFFDPGYEQLRKFLSSVYLYLKPGGRIILGFGGNGNEVMLDEVLNSLSLKKTIIGEAHRNEQFNLTSMLYLIEKLQI